MFVCNDCLTKYYENEPHPKLFQSYGRCEICEKTAGCSDIHHSQLIPKKADSAKSK